MEKHTWNPDAGSRNWTSGTSPPGATASTKLARLYLRQGASDCSEWLLHDQPGGALLEVGSHRPFGWTIRGQGLSDHVLSLLFLAGSLFVRSERGHQVRIDGRPADGGWTPLVNGAELAVGAVRLGTEIEDAMSERKPERLPTIVIEPDLIPGAVLESPVSQDPIPQPMPATGGRASLSPDSQDAAAGEVSWRWARQRQPHEYDDASAALLSESETTTRSGKAVKALVVTGLLACAYGGFCELLDHL